MPTAKPRYAGDDSKLQPESFSEELRHTLRSYSPHSEVETDATGAHPADIFVEELLYEARWASEELSAQRSDLTKGELHAERSDLLKALTSTHHKLCNLSRDFDCLLGVNADPLGCADKIHELIGYVEGAATAIDTQPPMERSPVKQHKVAVEMTIRVMRVLQDHGIEVSATADKRFKNTYISEPVRILKALGDEIRLVRDIYTWRDILIKAKESVSDFK
ncbi:hypothetical protein [Nitrosococcus wardiae]|uniref:Uncharacterized protein n=1 Tax=Nitrosococcus wardiae TaxID=1814290 RepID=A0A4P7BX05_9GAMM|nr:hypothetical protein [Nitrosococcus wardiae]QBQ53827.1 hypothetical protein E3U44_04350 [Nitrosococcus wardiae]